jgi:hypothetical protein
MEVTEKLYKQLFKRAMAYTYKDEDHAAECVNHVILSLHKFEGEAIVERFWGWANPVLKHKAYDLWKKNSERKFQEGVELNEFVYRSAPQEEDYFKELVADRLSQQDLTFALEYVEGRRKGVKKTEREKSKFLRLRSRIINPPGKKKSRYIVTDTKTGTTSEHHSKPEIAKLLSCNRANVEVAVKNNSLLQERYLIKNIWKKN